MSENELRVKIVKCSGETYWYKDCIGEIFTVKDFDSDDYVAVKPTIHVAYNGKPASDHRFSTCDCEIYTNITSEELQKENEAPQLADMLANEIKANDVNRERIRKLEAEVAERDKVISMKNQGNLSHLNRIAELKKQNNEDLRSENKQILKCIDDLENLVIEQQTDINRKNDAIIESFISANTKSGN